MARSTARKRSAKRCFSAWNDSITRPYCSRTLAYSIVDSKIRRFEDSATGADGVHCHRHGCRLQNSIERRFRSGARFDQDPPRRAVEIDASEPQRGLDRGLRRDCCVGCVDEKEAALVCVGGNAGNGERGDVDR